MTDPEPKIAEIVQQILVSLCWLDYDEAKQDMRADYLASRDRPTYRQLPQ